MYQYFSNSCLSVFFFQHSSTFILGGLHGSWISVTCYFQNLKKAKNKKKAHFMCFFLRFCRTNKDNYSHPPPLSKCSKTEVPQGKDS